MESSCLNRVSDDSRNSPNSPVSVDGGQDDSCHSRGAGINNICILNSSYCRS